MYKTASRKIGISLSRFYLSGGAAILLRRSAAPACMSFPTGIAVRSRPRLLHIHLYDGQLVVNINFNGVTLSTWTEISNR